MCDLDAMKAMLDRAKIEHRKARSNTEKVLDHYHPAHKKHQKGFGSGRPIGVFDLCEKVSCSCGKTLTISIAQVLAYNETCKTNQDTSDLATQRKRDGVCLTCGDAGEIRACAAFCRVGHGKIWG
jgi:hypothetical protein